MVIFFGLQNNNAARLKYMRCGVGPAPGGTWQNPGSHESAWSGPRNCVIGHRMTPGTKRRFLALGLRARQFRQTAAEISAWTGFIRRYVRPLRSAVRPFVQRLRGLLLYSDVFRMGRRGRGRRAGRIDHAMVRCYRNCNGASGGRGTYSDAGGRVVPSPSAFRQPTQIRLMRVPTRTSKLRPFAWASPDGDIG